MSLLGSVIATKQSRDQHIMRWSRDCRAKFMPSTLGLAMTKNMKHKKITKKTDHIIRIQKGEDVIIEVTKFCKENNIKSGAFTGIGACEKAELGSYSVKTKQYSKKTFEGEHEITSLTGIISNTKIHAHANISDEDFHVFGGHVDLMIVSATCEIHLIAGEEAVSRKLDEETGLELMDI